MAKHCINLRIVKNERIHRNFSRLELMPEGEHDLLTDIRPGQFMQIAIDDSSTFLRRPISISDVDTEHGRISILVRKAGAGTSWLLNRCTGDRINAIIPLGNGFPLIDVCPTPPLLVGGGVGIAPLVYLAKALFKSGNTPDIVIGARTFEDLLEVNRLRKYGQVYITTEDGSAGTKGFVTNSEAWTITHSMVYSCGPLPMMKAVAAMSAERNMPCYVSLENTMACGIGACLCCVEKTKNGNQCVCTSGPVFSTTDLMWG